MTLHELHGLRRAGWTRPQADDLVAWRRERRRHKRRAALLLRALFALLFLVGAAGGYLVATGVPPIGR
jgi:hypothetical protein